MRTPETTREYYELAAVSDSDWVDVDESLEMLDVIVGGAMTAILIASLVIVVGISKGWKWK